MFAAEGVKLLQDYLAEVPKRYEKLLDAILSRAYKTDAGAEFAAHGFSR